MQANDLSELAANIHTSQHPLAEYEVQLMIMAKDLSVYKATTDQQMKEDLLKALFLPVIKKITDGLEEGLTIRPYDPSDDDSDAVWSLPANDVTSFMEVQNFIQLLPDEMPPYDGDMGEMDNVAALALRVQTRFGECVVFQKLASNYILKKSRKMIAVFTGVSFKELEEPAAFQIAKEAHVIYFNENLYVLNGKNFEYLFDYKVEKEKIAKARITEILAKYSGNILLGEGKTLEGFLMNDKTSLDKLQRMEPTIVLSRDNLLARKLQFDLPIQVDIGSGKMVIEEKRDAKLFISILNEEYLIDDITGDKYVVKTKKKVVPIELEGQLEIPATAA